MKNSYTLYTIDLYFIDFLFNSNLLFFNFKSINLLSDFYGY